MDPSIGCAARSRRCYQRLANGAVFAVAGPSGVPCLGQTQVVAGREKKQQKKGGD